MKDKPTSKPSPKSDVPYNPKSKAAVAKFWDSATAHLGVDALRVKRGRPTMAEADRKEQIALRVDADVLAWYREQGTGWQTRMNAVLKAYRDATI